MEFFILEVRTFPSASGSVITWVSWNIIFRLVKDHFSEPPFEQPEVCIVSLFYSCYAHFTNQANFSHDFIFTLIHELSPSFPQCQAIEVQYFTSTNYILESNFHTYLTFVKYWKK